MAIEAGYPTNIVYKLYIRQCKCLLELGQISEAQTAFDKAVDAIDRSGLKKEMRQGMAANLQVLSIYQQTFNLPKLFHLGTHSTYGDIPL